MPGRQNNLTNHRSKRFPLALFFFALLMTLSIAFGYNRANKTNQDTRSSAETLGVSTTATPTQTSTTLNNNSTTPISSTKVDTSDSEQTSTKEDRQTWFERISWPQECEDAFTNTSTNADGGIEPFVISPNIFMVEVTCSIGANEESKLFYYVDSSRTPSKIVQQTFKQIKPDLVSYEDLPEDPIVRGATVFDSTKKLTIFTKYRAMGDCGSFSTYQLEGEKFVLKEIRAQNECDESQFDPKEWEVRYSLD